MATTKPSPVDYFISTTEDAADVLKRIAHLNADLNCATSNRNKAVLDLQTEAQPLIEHLSAQIAECQQALEFWAQKNRAEFGEKQSLEFPSGTLGFRIGNRTLGLLPKWTWIKVLAAMTAPAWEKYIRLKADPNKQALLAATSGDVPELSEAELKQIGLTVYREEAFLVTINPALAETGTP